MIAEIKSITDVKVFFEHLLEEECLNFHPDKDFKNYIHIETRLPSYMEKEANLRNKLLQLCFEVCDKESADIYEIGYQILFKKLLVNV